MLVIDSSETEDEDVENVPVSRDAPVPVQEVPELVDGFWVTPELAGNEVSDHNSSPHTPRYFLREGMNLLLDAIEIRQNILPSSDEQKEQVRPKKVVFAKDVVIIPQPVGADIASVKPTVEVVASGCSSLLAEAIASTSSTLPTETVACTNFALPTEAIASTSSVLPIEAIASTSPALPVEANIVVITVPADTANGSAGLNEEAIVLADQESVVDDLPELNTPIRTTPSANGVYFMSPTEAINDFILGLL